MPSLPASHLRYEWCQASDTTIPVCDMTGSCSQPMKEIANQAHHAHIDVLA